MAELQSRLGLLCVAVLCVILSLGLWPFHAPQNQVKWVEGSDGVVFGKHGTVQSFGSLNALDPQRGTAASIEFWVQPDHRSGSGTIVALYRPEEQRLFAIRQSLSDLEIRTEFSAPSGPARGIHFYVSDALAASLQLHKPVFFAMTFGPRGARVYCNDALVATAAGFWLPENPRLSRLIVGDSARQPDSFRGLIRGLAIFNTELDSDQVSRHYHTWTRRGRPDVLRSENNTALYLFNEGHGNTIHNYAQKGTDLTIPSRYMVVDKEAFTPFWEEFEFSRSYWSGNLKNIVGFVPVGFCFCGWVSQVARIKRITLTTVAIGTFVSVAIEVLQIFLPTRDSGTTDILTNTLGTYVGVLAFRHIYPAVVEKLPGLGWLGLGSASQAQRPRNKHLVPASLA